MIVLNVDRIGSYFLQTCYNYRNEAIQYTVSTLQTCVKCHMGQYNVTCMRLCHVTMSCDCCVTMSCDCHVIIPCDCHVVSCVHSYIGSVAVFDLESKTKAPIYQSTAKTGKHLDPVWQVQGCVAAPLSGRCSATGVRG